MLDNGDVTGDRLHCSRVRCVSVRTNERQRKIMYRKTVYAISHTQVAEAFLVNFRI